MSSRRRSIHDYLELMWGTKYAEAAQLDVESKFATMALAFKTDRFTLTRRVDVHKHQRDLAESSVNTEVETLQNLLNELRIRCKDVVCQEIIDKLQSQMGVVKHSTDKAICRAEMYGQVQQENKVFKALEIMIGYVENLKRTYESEHMELEDTKRILMENNIVLDHDQVNVIVDGVKDSDGGVDSRSSKDAQGTP
ncbi:unnamed protein product, partial [Notodromas monacha]